MGLDVNQLIIQYGYLALFIGCLAEGETAIILSGIAAHQGLLHYGWVVIVAMSGGFLGDTALFFVGRHFGERFLSRFSKYQSQIDKARWLIHSHPGWFVIGIRFMYGMRIIGPIIIGASRLAPQRFVLLNLIGATCWALIFVSLGYLCGEVIFPWLHRISHHFKLLFGIILTLLIALGIRLWHERHRQ